MSLSSPIQSGTYQIFNVAYPSQDADLLSPGGPTGVIGGYHANSDSGRMQWDVQNIVGASTPVVAQVTIYNNEIGTYAGIGDPSVQVTANTPVVGTPSPGPNVEWAVGSVGSDGEYAISLLNTPYFWTLADGADGTPIVLQPVGPTGFQANQQWTFVSVH